MSRILALLSLFLSMHMPVWAADVPTRIALYPVVRIAPTAADSGGASIRLGRLARIVADAETQRSLQGLEIAIGHLAKAGDIDSKRLIEIMQAMPELVGAEIVGPARISVAAARNAGSSEKAISEAAKALKAHAEATWPGDYRNLKIRPLDAERQLTLKAGSQYRFDFSGLDRVRRRTPVWIVISDQGRVKRSAIWFDVSGETLAWQALGPMDARATATQSQFVNRWRNLAEINRSIAAAPSGEHRLVVPMTSGEILTERHLEIIPAVDYGADIRVISRVGDVQIQTVATALQTAFVGDVIDLRSISSQERFEARVLDRNLVQIDSAAPAGRIQIQER